ncbi:MAG: C1 family peptidase [Candidatus Delongbacteria bacterium]|nr:C1 family peptidase [Candidatus Delongbacteria bacterium]
MNNEIKEFFKSAGFRAWKKYSDILKDYNIVELRQLQGALNPYLPTFKKEEVRNKCLVAGYDTIRKQVQTEKTKVRKLKKLLSINAQESRKILENLDKTVRPVMEFKTDPSFMSLGLKVSKAKIKHDLTTKDLKPSLKSEKHYVIPEYETRMGSVFDQGRRGTCVANAVSSLIDYLSLAKTSRQFLYHQCKMIDGSPNSAGTYMVTPFEILSDQGLIDYGTIKEKIWPYDPRQTDSEHQGPPPEDAFHTDRYFSYQVIKIRFEEVISDLKFLLSGGDNYAPTPVAMGFKLFSSFLSYNTENTGWVTMPLPGEGWIGNHAMLIVGWDDDDGVFIVRNSWGLGWAPQNKYQMPGHALFPYKYFEKYCHGGYSFLQTENDFLDIAERDRLYNNMSQKSSKGEKAASKKKRTKSKKKRKPYLLWFLILIVSAGLVIYLFFPKTFYLLRYYVWEIYLRIYTFFFDIFN